MTIERMSYIVKFHGKEVPKKLASLDINLIYVSKRANYAIVYCDLAKGEKHITSQINKTKGFISIEPSLLYEEEKNIKAS